MGIDIHTLSAKDGSDIMEITVGDKKFRMNSLYRPKVEAEKFATQFEELDGNYVLIVFGCGNGIIPNEIVRIHKAGGKIIFYEPSDDIVKYMHKNFENKKWIRQQDVLFVSPSFFEDEKFYKINDFHELLERVITYSNYKQVSYIALPNYREIFPEEYKDFEKKILFQIHRIKSNITTAKDMGKEAVVNNIMNLKYIPDSYCADSFCNIFQKDLPAIIVSAGPSLKKNVRVLKEFKNHALIVCVDSAAGYLIKEEVVPDLIVSVDAVKPISLFEDERLHNIPLIVSSDVNYNVLKCMKGSPIIFASSENTYIQSLYSMAGHNIEKLKSGGSVATMAFSLCMYWGFKNIILVGQDLAISDNQLHVGDVLKNNDVNAVGREKIQIEDINGNLIYTYADFYTYLLWFEYMIEVHPELNVIDATEGGAKIHGTSVNTLRNVFEDYGQCYCDFADNIKSTKQTFDSSMKKELLDRLKESKSNFEHLEKLLIHGIEISNRAVKLINNEELLSELDKEMNNICEYYDSLEEAFLVQRIIDATELDYFMSLFEKDINDSRKTQYKKMNQYFQCLLRAVKIVSSEWNILVSEMDV